MLKRKQVRIEKGLSYLTKHELEKIKTIKYSKFNIKFQISKIKFKKPTNTPEECLLKNKTYTINIYIPIELQYKNQKITA